MITKNVTTIIPERVVPEKAVTHDVYIAFDGTEFLQEWECLRYEADKNYEKIKSLEIEDWIEMDNKELRTLVYIKSKEDFDIVTQKQNQFGKLSKETTFNGKGCYLVSVDSDDDDEYSTRKFYIEKVYHLVNKLEKLLNSIKSFTADIESGE